MIEKRKKLLKILNEIFRLDQNDLDFGIYRNEDDESRRETYLIASLLTFYQQMKIYTSSKSILKPYLIEKPLMLFVGSSVNAVRKSSGKEISDVVDILLFVDNFIKNRGDSIATIQKIMTLDSGLNGTDNSDVFTNKFSFLETTKLDATAMFDDILKILFNTSSGLLHIENLKGVDGEIALRVGESEYFGVINVGDSDRLVKLCDANGLSVVDRDFSTSLFKRINETSSNLNILIGSKRFSEGWSSWRVSTLGLMNIGKKEGSQIIQLFGRGVRLKGYAFSLKRSRAIVGRELERRYQAIETLTIFGLKADYMRLFKEYLKNEGVPTDNRVESVLPKIKKLKQLEPQKSRNVKFDLKYSNLKDINKKVVLSLYREVDIVESVKRDKDSFELNSEILTTAHLSFVTIDNIFFALQEFKREKGWNNINISKSNIAEILNRSDWYMLYIPKEDMHISSFKNLANFEKIMITLLKKYMREFYINS